MNDPRTKEMGALYGWSGWALVWFYTCFMIVLCETDFQKTFTECLLNCFITICFANCTICKAIMLFDHDDSPNCFLWTPCYILLFIWFTDSDFNVPFFKQAHVGSWCTVYDGDVFYLLCRKSSEYLLHNVAMPNHE